MKYVVIKTYNSFVYTNTYCRHYRLNLFVYERANLGDGGSETPAEKSLANVWWAMSYILLLRMLRQKTKRNVATENQEECCDRKPRGKPGRDLSRLIMTYGMNLSFIKDQEPGAQPYTPYIHENQHMVRRCTSF